MYLFAGNCPSKRILILILPDSVIIHIRHIIYTVLDLKSKHLSGMLQSCLFEKEEENVQQKSEEKFFK